MSSYSSYWGLVGVCTKENGSHGRRRRGVKKKSERMRRRKKEKRERDGGWENDSHKTR